MATATSTKLAPVLIDGQWQASHGRESFQAMNPAKNEPLTDLFPVSTWEDCERILTAAVKAADQLRAIGPARIAAFLEDYAARIDAAAAELSALASLETALPVEPRLAKVELPR